MEGDSGSPSHDELCSEPRACPAAMPCPNSLRALARDRHEGMGESRLDASRTMVHRIRLGVLRF